jgi:hypothetical protein
MCVRTTGGRSASGVVPYIGRELQGSLLFFVVMLTTILIYQLSFIIMRAKTVAQYRCKRFFCLSAY